MLFADFLANSQQIYIYRHSFQKYSNSPEIMTSWKKNKG